MKIGKYPVKHSYRIPRLITDVFSVGLAVFILSVEYMFMTVYEDNLRQNIGDNIEKLALSDPTIGWKHWVTMIFPAAVLAAVNLADQLTKAQEGAENLRRQVKTYLDEASRAKNEAAELRRKLQNAQNQNNRR